MQFNYLVKITKSYRLILYFVYLIFKNMRKSTPFELQNRGDITDVDITEYRTFDKIKLIQILNDKIPYKRTIGAKLLVFYPDSDVIESLCQSLQKENKLYTKIAITETLASFGEKSITHLIPLLGNIGENQYKEIPEPEFKKKKLSSSSRYYR